jgi:uncharacterized protein (DUF1800 family)
MLRSKHVPQEKMTLFWHGHFAATKEKLRDCCKISLQQDTLRAGALGSFRNLLAAVAKDPAMLVDLDATHIKSPTKLIVTTYRKLGLAALPGVPGRFSVGKTLGQILL